MTTSAETWFSRFPDLGRTPVFTLRVKLSGVTLSIRVYEGPFSAPNHTTLFCEGRVNGQELFPRESFYVGVPGHSAIDGKFAKELVLSLFAMKPGDTDAEFFEHYTADQLAFVEAHGEELSIIKEERYGSF